MIRLIMKKLPYFLFSIAALVIWGSGIACGQYIKEYYQSVSVRVEKDKITKQELIRAIEYEQEKKTKEILSITAWNCLKKQTIENNELSNSADAWLFEVYGDMKQVYPMKFISGGIPNPEDYEGCVINENVAYELFGTSRVVGNFLTYQDKKYCIRGIVISKEPIFMIHIYNKEHAYSNLELVYEDKGDGKQLGNDFMVQNALADDYTMVEGCFYAEMLELLYRIPAWFLGFYLLYQFLKCIWKRRTLPIQVLVLLVGFVAFWYVIRYLMEFQVYIPERMIPTKWSDFSFWTEKYTAFQDGLEQIAYLTPVPKDVILIEYTKRCIYYILISLVCMIAFVSHRKDFLGENSGIMMSLFAIVMEGTAIFILFKTGKVFSLTRGYFCMIPFYIMSFDFKKRGRELWNLLGNKGLKEIKNQGKKELKR